VSDSYKKFAKLLLAMMVAMRLMAFARPLRLTREANTQIFLVIVGIVGILASTRGCAR
jgi:hypothetical protein